jgi:GNAT superfamily N-acetyltransferase
LSAPVDPLRIEVLGKAHDRSTFTCGSESLDRYLREQARQDAEKGVAAPFVLTLPPSFRVVGFYTLSASLVSADELPVAFAKKLPRYPQLPVTLLGRLAVDQSMKGKGIGEFLLMDALYRSLEASVNIAAMAVVVDAKGDAAKAFYEHFSFLPMVDLPRRLFLPMKTVSSLFGKSS